MEIRVKTDYGVIFPEKRMINRELISCWNKLTLIHGRRSRSDTNLIQQLCVGLF